MTEPTTHIDPVEERSRRRAKKWLWATVLAVVVMAGSVVWEGTKSRDATPNAPVAFCKATERYDKLFDREEKNYTRDIDLHIKYVEDIVATAPRKIRPDAETFLNALLAVQANPKATDNPATKKAVDNVNRFANQGCGVYQRQGGM